MVKTAHGVFNESFSGEKFEKPIGIYGNKIVDRKSWMLILNVEKMICHPYNQKIYLPFVYTHAARPLIYFFITLSGILNEHISFHFFLM